MKPKSHPQRHLMAQCYIPNLCLRTAESGEFLGDLLALDPTSLTGLDPTAKISGTPPSARQRHGFVSMGGSLYVHGGGVLEVGGV